MNPAIRPHDPAAEFYTEERCYITELSNLPEDPDCSIARARLEPGVTTRWHRLDGIAERYVVLIPPACRQRIANLGKTDLVFLAICTPRFRPERYENLDA